MAFWDRDKQSAPAPAPTSSPFPNLGTSPNLGKPDPSLPSNPTPMPRNDWPVPGDGKVQPIPGPPTSGPGMPAPPQKGPGMPTNGGGMNDGPQFPPNIDWLIKLLTGTGGGFDPNQQHTMNGGGAGPQQPDLMSILLGKAMGSQGGGQQDPSQPPQNGPWISDGKVSNGWGGYFPAGKDITGYGKTWLT